MRTFLATLLLFTFSHLQAQDYLERDSDKILDIDFLEGIPDYIIKDFENFNQRTRFGKVQGLPNEEYVATSARNSSIAINMKNIGQMVLYAKLFNKKDKTLFNHLAKRRGKITISSFRNEILLEDMTITISFNEDIFQQIHFNTKKSGIDRIEIDFMSEKDLFILEKLKVSPYNEKGLSYFERLEKSEDIILNITKDIEDEAATIKKSYEDQLGRIQVAYDKLSAIINGNKFESVATVQANSLNPFKSENFINHYSSILSKASAAERSEYTRLSSDLGESNLNNVAASIDNIFTGGKLSSLINLVDGLFSRSVNLRAGEAPIIRMGVNYYNQRDLSKGRVKLEPVSDQLVLKEITELTEKNQAFKKYIEIVVTLMKEDLDLLSELSRDIVIAKKLQLELEKLAWQIIRDFTDKDRKELITTQGIDFLKIGLELERNFKPDSTDITNLKLMRKKSIISIIKFNELISQFDQITSEIKTHYDVIYEFRPKERKKVFDGLKKHLFEIIGDWKDSQDLIIEEYTKKDGLKQYLSNATGLE
jgi:hypothetical protein